MQFVMKDKASVLIDGQNGSTGKGLLAAYLAMRPENEVQIATTNASANAGHTTVLADRTKFVTYHLPTFAVMQPNCYAYLNAGSVIDPELLEKEIVDVGFDINKLFIHPHAAVIEEQDRIAERDASSAATSIASTQKGVGAALARKIRREAKLAKDHPYLSQFVRKIDLNNHTCVVEVPQGFSLSLNFGNTYPYTTSRDITVTDAMGSAGLHPTKLGKVVMVIRTFGIRVGNIIDAEGVELGNSGPYYADQVELSWDELGVPEERTTVTKRIRRVFSFSQLQYKEALRMLRPDIVMINFLNYLPTAEQQSDFMIRLTESELEVGIVPKKLFGCGPRVDQVFDNFADAQDYLNHSKEKGE